MANLRELLVDTLEPGTDSFAVFMHRATQPAGDGEVRLTLLRQSGCPCHPRIASTPQSGSARGVAAVLLL